MSAFRRPNSSDGFINSIRWFDLVPGRTTGDLDLLDVGCGGGGGVIQSVSQSVGAKIGAKKMMSGQPFEGIIVSVGRLVRWH